MRKRILMSVAGLLLLLSDRGLPAQNVQTPLQMPNRFEIYYEAGLSNRYSAGVLAESHDSFDSEKKERVFDAQGGQVKYPAELTEDERKKIYEAVLQNNLSTIKNDFNLGNRDIQPLMVGRLRLDIDGRITEIRFNLSYGRLIGGAEWTRLKNVLDVIDNTLKVKDQKQTLPGHNVYF